MNIRDQCPQIKTMRPQNLDSDISDKKRKFILLEFTKELIRQSGEEIYKLEDILKEEDEEIKEEREHEKIKIHKKSSNILKPKPKHPEKSKIDDDIFKSKPITLKKSKIEEDIFKSKPMLFAKPTNYPIRRPTLFIPKPKLPQRFKYLRPVPTDLEIDLGKLNSLINDPLVKNIECNGPGQNVVIVGIMGRKKTNIFLSKEEISEIVKKFSETTKIPIHEGIFRAVAGKLIFSAIISNLLGSKFIIKKMTYGHRFR